MKRLALLVVLLVLASSASTLVPPDDDRLSRDTIGWEDGYWYDDPVDVTVADGLNESERAAITARAMARVEYLRGLEFRETVDVRITSRAEYLASRNGETNATHSRWNNQVWKALFLVGADRDVSEVLDGTLGASVVGYYAPGSGDIVIVSDDPTPVLSRGTLVHELVHAMQDQHFGLASDAQTQDAQLARNGVVEGEANNVQRQYAARCGSEWSCVDTSRARTSADDGDDETATEDGDGTSGDDGDADDSAGYDRGVFTVIYQPYAAGPDFVEHVAQRGGTDALNALYEDFPDSSEQIIHPEAYPEERPVNVTVPDRSSEEWRRFDHEPVADTVGEASIYAMVVANGIGEPPQGGQYGYEHPISAGWGGDSVVPYRVGERNGYVWETVWDTDADAREFHEGYLALLDDRGAERLGPDRYRLPAEDPFGGAYRVSRAGDTVRIVHGPTPESLGAIHAR
jgi:hypothetical protein